MGKYINEIEGVPIGTSFRAKCQSLEDHGAIMIEPTHFQDNMVCVVDNTFFAAAAYAYDEREFQAMLPFDGRSKQWYTYQHAARDVD